MRRSNRLKPVLAPVPKKTNMIPLINQAPEPIYPEIMVHKPTGVIGTPSRVEYARNWMDPDIIELETKNGPITGFQSDFEEATGQ
jgi:hypothetical protein